MTSLTLADAAGRTGSMAEKKGWRKKVDFKPGGTPGKLHKEIGVPVSKTIPVKRLEAAAHSDRPEVRRDAVRAETMKKWNHSGKKRSLYKED